MRHANKCRILVGVLGILVLLIPGQALAGGFSWLDGWGDFGSIGPWGPSGPSGPVEPAPSVPSSADLANQLATDLNDARTQNGLQPLTRSSELDQIAASRSQDMANRHYFSHTTPDGTTVLNVLVSQGVKYTRAGEVIAEDADSDDQCADIAAQGLLNSSEHRAIILDRGYTQFGIGEATDSDGMHIFTGIYMQG